MTTAPEQPTPEGPPFAPRAIPTDPVEQEAWKEQFTDELLRFPGGVDAPWRDTA